MHHAAMANKREMMLTLARLGCDYRAKAEGIDGATAAFVLCGQHGKTTQQQVIVPTVHIVNTVPPLGASTAPPPPSCCAASTARPRSSR